MIPFGLIVNANARAVRRAPGLIVRLADRLGRDGELRVTANAAELARAIGDFKAREVALVAACGGDGTHHAIATELVRAYSGAPLPMFASVRGGTVNTIARNFGVRGRPDRLLARLLSAARNNTLSVVEHDLIEVDGRFGFLFASLMGARFLKAFYEHERRTIASAARLTVQTMASSLTNGKLARSLFSMSRVELTVDDEPPHSERYRLLVASTVRDVGFGFRVPYDAGKKRGYFHVIASGLSTTKMALQLPRVFSGKPLGGAPHLDRLARRLKVRFADEESYTLDGDLFAARELTLRAGPRLPIAVY